MKQKIKQWWLIIIAIAIFLLAIFYSSAQIAAKSEKQMPVKKQNITRPTVSVVSVMADTYAAHITGYGELKPHFSLSLTAEVNGRVERLSPNFEVGQTVKKGDWLVKLEQSDYLSAFKEAQQNVAAEKLNLLEEERQAVQAKSEWLASGMNGEPDSELVLRKPQLETAQARYDYAKAVLVSANKDLNQTIITAPFDALVTVRSIALGTYLQAGNDVATLFSTDRLEAAVPLSNKDWSMLPDNKDLISRPATLKNVETAMTWSARVLRAEQHVDSESRQRSLIIAIDAPLSQTPNVYSGTFVSMSLEGKKIDNIWKLPNSALSQRGQIWYVKNDNTLARFDATALFAEDGFIFVAVPESLVDHTQSIVSHPLNNYLDGMYVEAILESNNGE
tara:strand:- start:49939 stop:51108 length:1170 start_codon:yes stop_codon:yes gene_type:complete